MIAVLPAPHGRHAAHRTRPSRLRALRHPLRALQLRRWCAALRRDAAELAQSDREYAAQRRQWQLRVYQLRALLPPRQRPAVSPAPANPETAPPGAGLTFQPAMSGRRPSVRTGRAATLTDMTVTVHRPEFAAVPQAAITGGRRYAEREGR